MQTWAVINQKGGVGKTTTTVSLAGHLCQRDRRLLLVDLDPHGSLTAYLGYDPDSLETGIYSLFNAQAVSQAGIARLLSPTPLSNTFLFAASTALATLDRQMGAGHGKGLIVANAIAGVADKFEHCIIDCPPMLGILMINALAACDRLLIPAQTDYLSLKGLERMVHTLGMVVKSLGRQKPYLIVPTMFDRRTRASSGALARMRETYGRHVWDSVIPIDTKFRDASKAGVPLSQLAPRARGSRAYLELLEHLLDADRGDRDARARRIA